MEATILQIQDFIAESEIELALNKLRSVFSLSNSELVNDTLLVSGQFKKLQSDIRKGIIDYKEENLRHNRILDAILSLVDEIKQNPTAFNEIEQVESELDQSIQERGADSLPPSIKTALFDRIAYVKEKGLHVPVLWIDDAPANNGYESKILGYLGLTIDFASSSQMADQFLSQHTYELILSDINREESEGEGFRYHRELLMKGIDIPIIFYTGGVDRSKGVPPFAFGIADLPNALFHLVLDVLERKY